MVRSCSPTEESWSFLPWDEQYTILAALLPRIASPWLAHAFAPAEQTHAIDLLDLRERT